MEQPKPKIELTLEERHLIQLGIATGMSLSEISRSINRGKNTVIAEVRRNGGPDNYTAEKAQQRAIANQESRRRKNSAKMLGRPSPIRGFRFAEVDDRFNSLQMQLDILFEEIEQLKKTKK